MKKNNETLAATHEIEESRLRAIAKLGEPTGWFDGPTNTLTTAKDISTMLNFYMCSMDRAEWENGLDNTVCRMIGMLNDILEILDVQVREVVEENFAFHYPAIKQNPCEK